MKKALSLLTAAAMLAGLFVVMAPISFAAEGVDVSTAAELQETVRKINSGELGADTNITLTADIDLAGVTDWKPLKSYSGIFDGTGHTVKNLTHTVTVANNNNDKLDGGANTAEYVITQSAEGLGSNCFGEVGIALLAVKTEGATLKNFTLKDSSLSMNMNFNKNWQPYYAAVVACMDGGSISGVKLENVDLTVDNQSGINQGFLGFAGLMAGVTTGAVTISDCSIDAASTLDASANKKFDVAAYVGRHSSESPITVTKCATAATVKAAPDVSNKDGLMYNGDDAILGGWAAAIVGRFNDNTAEGARDSISGCTNTGTLTGAHVNEENGGLIGDVNTRTDIAIVEDSGTGTGTGTGTGEGSGEQKPPATGSITLLLVSVAVLSLAGIRVASRKRERN